MDVWRSVVRTILMRLDHVDCFQDLVKVRIGGQTSSRVDDQKDLADNEANNAKLVDLNVTMLVDDVKKKWDV